MPETFSPIIWHNDTSPALNESNLNRIEVGIESLDDRAATLELGVVTPVTVPFATSITLNATQGSLFRCVAVGDLTLDGIVGGLDGQTIALQVRASGGARTLSFTGPGAPVTIPSGTAWWGRFSYDATNGEWLRDTAVASTNTGTGSGTELKTRILTYASSITLDATLADIFQVTLTGDLTLAGITGATDCRVVHLNLYASTATRTLSLGSGADSVAIPAGNWWFGTFRYRSPADLLVLAEEVMAIGSAPGGGGGSPATALVDSGRVDTDTIA